MCGITGIVAFNNEGAKFLVHTDLAIETLKKRGPDSCGSYNHNRVSLGHTRLSIIDTSEAASQPFTDSTGRYTIVYNGEIYNYKELRRELIKKGVSFKSESDTEVLLHLYIEHGENCLHLLNGFFAFAIYDKQNERLFLARDRFGIKPLLYYLDDDKFIFGSELKALLAYKIPRKLDTISLFMYLQMNYIPGPHSILQKVRKIESGTFATIDIESNFSEHKYYQIHRPVDNEGSPSLSDYESVKVRLHSLMELAVKDRLVADVPLGTFLSGGIDSSIITALAAKHKKDIQSFSIGFKDEPYFDETKYAELVAKKVKSKHTVFYLSNQDLLEHVFEVLDYMDEPFGDSSAIPVNILSKFTKEHVTVALSGDGADEMFAGYNKHYAEFRARNAGLVNQLLKGVSPLLDLLPQSRNSKIANLSRQINRYSKGAKLKHKERYWKWASILDEEEANYLLKERQQEKKQRASDEGFRYKKRKEMLLKTIRKTGDFNDVLYTDMNLVLKDDMLKKVDSMSMARSLEVRTPFLDHNLVDFAFTLPAEFKINSSSRKKILRDTFKSYLPDELYNRGKMGFEVPLLKWFREDLRDLINNDLLKDSFIEEQGIFNLDAIKNLKLRLYSNNPKDTPATVWAIIVFQYWWKKYMQN